MPETIFGKLDFPYSTVKYFKYDDEGNKIKIQKGKNLEDSSSSSNKQEQSQSGKGNGHSQQSSISSSLSTCDTGISAGTGSTHSQSSGFTNDSPINPLRKKLLKKNVHYLDSDTFIKASYDYLKLFDLLGTAASIVKSDITGNIHKLEKFTEEFCSCVGTVNVKGECIIAEMEGKQNTQNIQKRSLENQDDEGQGKDESEDYEYVYQYSYDDEYTDDPFFNDINTETYKPETTIQSSSTFLTEKISDLSKKLAKTTASTKNTIGNVTNFLTSNDQESQIDESNSQIATSSPGVGETCHQKCNLFSIIYKELLDDTTDITSNKNTDKKLPKSAADALVWLKRGLWMIQQFFENMLNSEDKDTVQAFQKAYNSVLAPYHNFIAKGLVSGAMRLTPNYKSFINSACTTKTDKTEKITTCEKKYGTSEEKFKQREKVVTEEVQLYMHDLKKVLLFIDEFYKKYNINDLQP